MKRPELVRKGWGRRVAGGFLVLSLLILAGGYLAPPLLRGRVAAELGRLLGVRAGIYRLHGHPLWRVTAEGFHGEGETGGMVRNVAVGRLEVRWRPWAILFGGRFLAGIRAERVHVDLDAAGRPPPLLQGGAKEARSSPHPPAHLPPLLVRGLSLRWSDAGTTLLVEGGEIRWGREGRGTFRAALWRIRRSGAPPLTGHLQGGATLGPRGLEGAVTLLGAAGRLRLRVSWLGAELCVRAEADGVRLDPFLADAAQVTAEGVLSVSGHLAAGGAWRLGADVRVRGHRLGPLHDLAAVLRGSYGPRGAAVDLLRIRAREGRLLVRGRWRPGGGVEGAVELEGEGLALAPGWSFGRFAGTVRLQGPPAGLTGELALSGRDWAAPGGRLRAVAVRAGLGAPPRGAGRRLAVEVEYTGLTAGAFADKAGRVAARAVGTPGRATLTIRAQGQTGTAQARGEVARLEGGWEAVLRELALHWGGRGLALSGPVVARWRGGVLLLPRSAFRCQGGAGEVEGRLDRRGIQARVLLRDQDLEAWRPWLGVPGKVTGRGLLALQVRGEPQSPALSGRLEVAVRSWRPSKPTLPGIEELHCRVTVEGGHLRLESLSARIGGGRALGRGEMHLQGLTPVQGRVELSLADVDLSALPGGHGLAGRFSGRLKASGRPASPRLRLDLEGRGLRYRGEPVGDLRLAASQEEGGEVRVDRLALAGDGYRAAGSLRFPGRVGWGMEGLQAFPWWRGEGALEIAADERLAQRLGQPLGFAAARCVLRLQPGPAVLATLALRGVRLEGGTAGEVRAQLAWDGEGLRVERLQVETPEGRLRGALAYPWRLTRSGPVLERKGALRGELHAEEVAPGAFLPPLGPVRRLEGRLGLDLFLQGTAVTPAVRGALRLEALGIRFADPALPAVDGLTGLVRLEPGRVETPRLAGSLGREPFEVAGAVGYRAGPERLEVTDYEVHLAGRRLLLYSGEDIRLRVDFQLSLAGDARGGKLTGWLAPADAQYLRDIPLSGGASPSVPVAVRVPLPRLETPFGRALQLDVALRPGEGVLVDTNVARFRAVPELRVQGTAAAPVLTGRVFVREGELYTPTRTFRVALGEVEFFDRDPQRPYVNLVARTRITGIEVEVVATGPVDRLQVDFHSHPPLPREDIASLIVLGALRTEVTQADALRLIGTQGLFYLYEHFFPRERGRPPTFFAQLLDRIHVETIPARTPLDAGDRIRAEFRLLDYLYLRGERDAYGDHNFDLLLRLRFGGPSRRKEPGR